MKKITTLLLAIALIGSVNAQIVYPTIVTDNFETSNGIPANFNCYKQTVWNITTSPANNPYPYTGTLWKDLYSDNATAANKTYRVSAIAEERTGGSGTQCLKFEMTGLAFNDATAPQTVRLRSNNNIISFDTNNGENNSKYEVTFWARVDGADKNVIMNAKNPNEYLTITSTWQKFTIDRYCTGTSSTALGIDFYPTTDNSDYVVYMDELTVKQRVFVTPQAASGVLASTFTANWSVLSGATGYNVSVQKVINDGVNPVTYETVEGSPFAVSGGSSTNLVVNGLTPATTYRYKVSATDGTITTLDSEWIAVATTDSTTGFSSTSIKSLYGANGKIYVEANSGNNLQVFNQLGQLVYSCITNGTRNEITMKNKGIYIVKLNNVTRKIQL